MVGCVRALQINCLEGSTFMVSDVVGDAGPDHDEVLGLFYRDMRHLSRWQLAIDGERLDPLSNGASDYRSATFFLAGSGSTVYQNPTLSVIRERTLGQGNGEDLHEKLTVINSGREEMVIELSINFDADFADLFEVKDRHLTKKGTISRRAHSQHVELIYQREHFEPRGEFQFLERVARDARAQVLAIDVEHELDVHARAELDAQDTRRQHVAYAELLRP